MSGSTSSQLLLNPRLPQELRDRFTQAWSKFSFEDAVGIVTSGSESTKALGAIVVLSREALRVSAAAVNRHLKASSIDVWGLALPLFHVGGYSIPVRAKLSNSKVVEFAGSWDAVSFVKWLEENSVTLLSLVPTQVFDLVAIKARAPKSLRAIVVGGGRLDETLHREARALGWPCLQSYGLTECSSQVATADIASDGRELRVLDHVEVKTVSEPKNPEVKKIYLRSNALFSAKIIFNEQDVASLIARAGDDGWFETSDLGEILFDSLSGRQTLRIDGRGSDVVKILGELVDLSRVRELVEYCCSKESPETSGFQSFRQKNWVVARPDTRRGFSLGLVLESGFSSDVENLELRALGEKLLCTVNERLAPYERLMEVHIVEKLPRSSLGKILTAQLVTELGN